MKGGNLLSTRHMPIQRPYVPEIFWQRRYSGRMGCRLLTNASRASRVDASNDNEVPLVGVAVVRPSDELSASQSGPPDSAYPDCTGTSTDLTTAGCQSSGVLSVLVVEDEPALRNVLKRYLAKNGYRVMTASDGIEAMEVASSGREVVDLVITDVQMPNMKGNELAEQLRKVCPEAKIIFMSGFAGSLLDVRDSAALLAKPFSEAELLHHIGRVLGSDEAAS
jgi:CheY-like chemotaxis protein